MSDLPKEENFSLKPFIAPVSGVEGVCGSVCLSDEALLVTYTLTGNISSISVPLPQGPPIRRDALWKKTCFECFVQCVGSEDYYEVNLSPGGAWNVYHFDAYRTGMTEEQGVLAVGATTSTAVDQVVLQCRIPCPCLLKGDASINVGVSCVLLHKTGALSYWALEHPGDKPDFHDPGSFRIQLGLNA